MGISCGRQQVHQRHRTIEVRLAQDFAAYLVESAYFPADHVKVLIDKDATKSAILEHIGLSLPRLARKGDLVVIYFSTGGSPSKLDIDGINYLAAYDTNPDSLY